LAPGTGSKCKCGILDVSNVVIVNPVNITFVTVPTCYVPGQPITFVFNITNPVAATFSSIQLSDTLGATIKCCSTYNTPCNTYTTPPFNTIGPLPGFSWWQCQAIVVVNSPTPTTISETIMANSTIGAVNFAVTSSSPTVTVGLAALTAIESVVYAGDVTWTVTVINTGGITLTISISSPTYTFNCPTSTVSAGSTLSCTATTSVGGTTCYLSDSVTVTGVSSDSVCSTSATAAAAVNLNGRVCRPVNGNCDIPEICDTTSQATGFCPYDQVNPTVCIDHIRCTVDACSLSVPHDCSHTPTNSLCDNCTCTGAICSPSDANSWSDGCIHFFGNVAGSVLLSTDSSFVTCSNVSFEL